MRKILRSYLCIALSITLIIQATIPVSANELSFSEDELLTSEDIMAESLDVDDEDSYTATLPSEAEELSGDVNDIPSDDLSSDSVNIGIILDNEEPQEEVTEVKQATDLPDADELFAMYADQEFGVDYFEESSSSNGIEPEGGGSAYLYLNDLEKLFYDKAIELIEAVANGEESETEKFFTPAELGLEDLSYIEVADLYDCTLESNSWKARQNADKYAQAVEDLKSHINIDMKKVYGAVSADHPEWLYWFGRSYAIGLHSVASGLKGNVKPTSSTTGTADGYVQVAKFCVSFTVSKTYAVSKENGKHEADVTLTGATKTAVANAKSIANSYSSLGDYDKLLAFKERICQMVTYNDEAAESSSAVMGSDPWELIYVFDNKSDTNVVCEGYAKAFQYLCDLSSFTNSVDTISVSGLMDGGGHKWNIVKFNGVNFLVDVTNCDNVSSLTNGHTGLFMKGFYSGNARNGYVIRQNRINLSASSHIPEMDINYTYKEETLNLYADDLDALTLSADDFDPNNQPAPEKIVITQHPQNASVLFGATCAMSVEATGSGLTYQWQYYNGRNWVNASEPGNKTNTIMLDGEEERNNRSYRCVITDKNGQSVTSNSATLTVKGIIKITKQPQNTTAFVGDDAVFTITATGEGLGYRWQYSPDGNTWSNANNTGYATATLTVPATKNLNGYYYRCVVSDTYNMSVTSNPAKLTVKEPVKITKQPQDVSAVEGTDAVFSIKATGEGLRYLWVKSSDGIGWTDTYLPGGETDTLTVPANKNYNNYYFCCVVTDEGNNSVWSDMAQLTVMTPLEITEQPQNALGEMNSKVSFTVKVVGDDLTYQWYYCNASANPQRWSVTGATGAQTPTATVVVNDFTIKNLYKCIIKDKHGNTVESDVVKVIKKNQLKITKQPEDTRGVYYNSKVTFSVATEGDGLIYQWYYCNKSLGTERWNVTGATGAKTPTITVVVNDATFRNAYKCVITDQYGNSTESDSACILYDLKMHITKTTTDTEGVLGSTVKFETEVEGEGLSYQWYYCRFYTDNWYKTDAVGATTPEITVAVNETTLQNFYKCVITDEYGYTLETRSAIIIKREGVSITKQPQNVEGEMNSKVKFNVEAQGDDLTYQWYYCNENTKPQKWNITGATGAKTATATVVVNDYTIKNYYKCVITDKYGSRVETNIVRVIKKGAFHITKQPTNAEGAANTKVKFSVTAEGEGLSYQWYYSNVNSNPVKWYVTGATGAKTATATVVVNDSTVNNYYKCVITDKYGNSVETNKVRVIKKTVAHITKQPTNAEGMANAKVKFTVIAEGDGLSYQWYYCNESTNPQKWSVTGAAGAKTSTATVVVNDTTIKNYYKCVITDKYGNSMETDKVRVINTAYARITKQPKDVMGETGSKVKLSVTATGEGLTYQWYYCNVNSNPQKWYATGAPGAKSATATVIVNDTTTNNFYKCVIKDIYSNTVETKAVRVILSENGVVTNSSLAFTL